MKCPKILASLFVWVFIPDLCHSQQEQFAGPFKVKVRRIDQCDESGTRQVDITSTRISKVGRNKYVYSTNVTIGITINDDMEGKVDAAIFGNGGWRPHYLQAEVPQFCTSLKQLAPAYYDALKHIFNDCPISPGTYEIKDVEMENLKVDQSVPSFPYGKYRTDFSGNINGTLVGCIRLYSDVVPAKRARPPKIPKNNS